MMPSETTLWHNPRCSKSRETLSLLQERGVQLTIRLYLKDAPSKAEITALRDAMGVTAIDLMRKGEKVFKDLNLSQASESTMIAAMEENPILIERPILIHQSKAAIGRPPENVLEIL